MTFTVVNKTQGENDEALNNVIECAKLSVFQKDIYNAASAKLQRMKSQLLNYDVNIEY